MGICVRTLCSHKFQLESVYQSYNTFSLKLRITFLSKFSFSFDELKPKQFLRVSIAILGFHCVLGCHFQFDYLKNTLVDVAYN